MKLDYHLVQPLLNGFLGLFFDPKKRPTFFRIDEVCPELNAVTAAYPAIRREFERHMKTLPSLPQYHDLDPNEGKISDKSPKRWNVLMLDVLGFKPEGNCAHFPETCRAVSGVPNLIQAFFSILDPEKSVPEHEGPYYGYLRYHLGVQCPTQNPPHLVVNKQPYVWKDGEAVMFDDSWPHSVVNHCASPRAVLIIDIRRPLPSVADAFNRFVIWVARHTYYAAVARKADQYATRRPQAVVQAAQ